MPRTKRIRQTVVMNAEENVKPTKSKVVRDMLNVYLKAIDTEMDLRKLATEHLQDRLTLEINSMLQQFQLKFHQDVNKTTAELTFQKQSDLTTICEISSIRNNTADTTKSSRRSKNPSSGDSILRSTTRSNIKKAKTTSRASRSLSRSKMQQMASSYTTPLHNNTSSATFALVTPKVKPNTPQVVLRRPKQGEIAISMQGSPLMVSTVMSDQRANVNIPLEDGRVLSIQPQRGLRASQIPDLDAETRRQIEALRDNLNKVCALNARR